MPPPRFTMVGTPPDDWYCFPDPLTEPGSGGGGGTLAGEGGAGLVVVPSRPRSGPRGRVPRSLHLLRDITPKASVLLHTSNRKQVRNAI